MLTKETILSGFKELNPSLYKDYAVKEIGLFGSFSDNTNNEESDIDLIVERQTICREIGFKLKKY